MQRQLWLITLVLLLGFGLRVINMEGVPTGLQHDEIFKAEEGVAIITDGDIRLFYESNQGHEGIFVWLLSIAYLIVGRNLLMIKLMPWFIGMLTIAVSYRVFGRIYSRSIGLFASMLFAFTFFFIFLNRVGLRANLVPLIALLVLYQIYKLYIQSEPRWSTALWLGVLMGISVYTYTAAWSLLIAFGAILVYLLIFYRDTIKRTWKPSLLVIGVTGLLILPMVSIRLSANEGFNRINSVADPIQAASEGDFMPIINNVVDLVGMVAFTGDPIWRYNIADRPFYVLPIGLLFYLGLLIGFVDRRNRKLHGILILLFLCGITPSVATDSAPSFLRSVVALPIVTVVIAYALYWLINRLSPQSYHKPVMLISSCVLALVVLIGDQTAFYTQWQQEPEVLQVYRDDLEQLASTLATVTTPVTAVSTSDTELDPLLYSWYQHPNQITETVFFEGAFNMVLPQTELLLLTSPLAPIQYENTAWLDRADTLTDTQRDELTIRNQLGDNVFTPYLFTQPDALEAIYDPVSETEFYIADGQAMAYPIRFADILEISHVIISRKQVNNVNDGVNLDLYLNPLQSYIGAPVQIFAHLLNADGEMVAQRDLMGVHPTQWNTDTTIVQLNYIPIWETIPEGTYTIALGLYNWDTGARYPIVDADNNMLAEVVNLGTIDVRAPE